MGRGTRRGFGVRLIRKFALDRRGATLIEYGLVMALMFLVIAGPFLTHATTRAARIREKGDWRPGQGGQPPREEAQ